MERHGLSAALLSACLSIAMVGCMTTSGPRRVNAEATIKISDKCNLPTVCFSICNSGRKELRIWELWNSWGYYTVTVTISHGGKLIIAKKKPAEFTRNGPTVYKIAPGQCQNVVVDLNDGDWDLPFRVGTDDRLIRVELNIPPGIDAKEFGVFVGNISSTGGSFQIPPAHVVASSDYRIVAVATCNTWDTLWEIVGVLGEHGIPCFFEGRCWCGVHVPNEQADLAKKLLRHDQRLVLRHS